MSLTVTVPLVGAPPALLTVSVYVPFCPCVKLPLCVLAIVTSATPLIVVGSLELLLPALLSPPPETVAVFVKLSAEFGATVTGTLMTG